MFVGFHDRQLDDKGRCALPATYRPDLGEACYVSIDPEGCITVRTIEAFENHANELIEREKRGELTMAQRRRRAQNSAQVTIDKQGRITLEERFRQHARLAPGAPVVVVGVFDAIQLWKPERYAALELEAADEDPGRPWDD